MKFRIILVLIIFSICCASCFKKETPYPVPPKELFDTTVYESTVALGPNYINQIYFSLTNGIVKTNEYNIWDIAFSTTPSSEIWMNNGKNILLYLTNVTQFSEVTTTNGLNAKNWLYDDNKGAPGTSGLGNLKQEHLNKVIIAKINNNTYFKFKITNFDSTSYTIAYTGLSENSGNEITVKKDDQYNFIYFSFINGIIDVEPRKSEWDILFTRYRYIYKAYNPDGSDFLYLVSGVLTNPHNTKSAGDSVNFRNFKTFNLDSLAVMDVNSNLDNIGFNWKTVDIQTGNYKVNDKMIYVIKDQKDIYWKLHFYSFVNNLGEKGNPYFRFSKL